MQIPILNVGLAKLAKQTLNYFNEEGNLVVAPDTPEHQRRKREWELREYGEIRVSAKTGREINGLF